MIYNLFCFIFNDNFSEVLLLLFSLGSSDLSVWCFNCDAYLDAQVIPQLRPVHETAYILKFGEAPPIRTAEPTKVKDDEAEAKTLDS